MIVINQINAIELENGVNIIDISSDKDEQSINKSIISSVEKKFSKCLLKSEFETKIEYIERLKKDGKKTFLSLIKSEIESQRNNEVRFHGYYEKYDAERQKYLIGFVPLEGEGNEDNQNLEISISPNMAKSLKENDFVVLMHATKYELINGKWKIFKAIIYFTHLFMDEPEERIGDIEQNKEALNLKTANKIYKNATYYCNWDFSQKSNFNQNQIQTPLLDWKDFNFNNPIWDSIIASEVDLNSLINDMFNTHWNSWNNNYKDINFSNLINFELNYADSVNQNVSTSDYYGRIDKYRFSAIYSGNKREIPLVSKESMKRVCSIYDKTDSFSINIVNNIKYEYQFYIDNKSYWFALQAVLENPFAQEIKSGTEVYLYCLFLNEHTSDKILFNSFLISEFRKRE
jgi:NADH:ubiquinone oxidoreductase subunit C